MMTVRGRRVLPGILNTEGRSTLKRQLFMKIFCENACPFFFFLDGCFLRLMCFFKWTPLHNLLGWIGSLMSIPHFLPMVLNECK